MFSPSSGIGVPVIIPAPERAFLLGVAFDPSISIIIGPGSDFLG
jgi:hypothetical protein